MNDLWHELDDDQVDLTPLAEPRRLCAVCRVQCGMRWTKHVHMSRVIDVDQSGYLEVSEVAPARIASHRTSTSTRAGLGQSVRAKHTT